MWALKVPGNVMLLGIVDTEWNKNTTGQEARDNLRCGAMKAMKFIIKTIDDKHSEVNRPNHCQANFCDARRFKMSMTNKWGENYSYSLDHIILDYFFSPVSVCLIY